MLRQPKWIEGDVFAKEEEWSTLAEPKNQVTRGMLFEIPTMEMTKHLKPLYIKAHINGKPFNRVFVDGGDVLNIIPLTTMVRLGKNAEDLISTNMTGFMGPASHAMGIIIDDVTVGSKVTRFAFFVIEGNPSYAIIISRDWIHTSESVSSTLHQKFMIWIGGKVEVIEADRKPFSAEVKMLEAIFYSPYLHLISILEGYEEGGVGLCELSKEGFRLKSLADARPATKSND